MTTRRTFFIELAPYAAIVILIIIVFAVCSRIPPEEPETPTRQPAPSLEEIAAQCEVEISNRTAEINELIRLREEANWKTYMDGYNRGFEIGVKYGAASAFLGTTNLIAEGYGDELNEDDVVAAVFKQATNHRQKSFDFYATNRFGNIRMDIRETTQK